MPGGAGLIGPAAGGPRANASRRRPAGPAINTKTGPAAEPGGRVARSPVDKLKLLALLAILAVVLIALLFYFAIAPFSSTGRATRICPSLFGADYVEVARQINALPEDEPKFVVIEARGMAARGIPIPAQTVLFRTDTFSDEARETKNLYFLSPSMARDIPPGSHVWTLSELPSEPPK